jgi:uncharacterized protein DUF4352
MRTPYVRRRRVPWGNVVAGVVALIALGALAVSPFFAVKAIGAIRHHEVARASAAANHVNQDVRDAGLDFVVHSTRCGDPRLRAEDGTNISATYGAFCVVDVTVHNDGTGPASLAQAAQLATGSRGAVYPSDARADTMINGGNPAVIPGESWDAKLIYDVPPGIELVTIDLHGSEYSRGVSVRL